MKYLLKAQYKRRPDERVAVALSSSYHEFDNITDIMSHIHKNAYDLLSYEVFEMHLLEKDSPKVNNNRAGVIQCTTRGVNIDGESTSAMFE